MDFKKEFFMIVLRQKHSEDFKFSRFYLEVLRSESEDIIYFIIYDTDMNRVFNNFCFGSETSVRELFQMCDGSKEFTNDETDKFELSETGFNFMKRS